MAEFTLRDYQNNQLDYLKKNTTSGSKCFSKNIYLQSPTGSGKTIVMLEYIKWYLSEHPRAKLFISTGFNELVYQFYDMAVNAGINTEILIGKNNAVCKLLDEYDSYDRAFVRDAPRNVRCDNNLCKSCSIAYNECYYNKVINNIVNNSRGLLVITNHSTLFSSSESIFKNFNGGFIDECQTIGDFYQSFISIEITPDQIYKLLDLADRSDASDISVDIFRAQVETCNVNIKALNNIAMSKIMTERGETPIYELVPMLASELDKLNSFMSCLNSNTDYYIYPQNENDKFTGIKIDKFFMKVNLPTNVCLVSATVDSYTKNICNANDGYTEHNCNMIDYKNSTVTVYDQISITGIIRFVSMQKADHGLILSTRLDLVNDLFSMRRICDYEIVKDRGDLTHGKRQILVGSKKLFQGIDIGDIGFIIINKLPFQRYDEGYKRKMIYFDKHGENSYRYYTIPYTTNQLIQCMGRLWRNPGDHGNIALFDGRAKDKHSKILADAIACRDGIKVEFK